MITLETVHDAICYYYQIPEEDKWNIFYKTNRWEWCEKRHMFQTLSMDLTKMTYQKIANYSKEETGNRWTHSTVILATRSLKDKMEFDKELRETYQTIKAMIKRNSTLTPLSMIYEIYRNRDNEEFTTKLEEYLKAV